MAWLVAKLALGGKCFLGFAFRGLDWLIEKPVRLVVALLLVAVAYHLVFIDPRVRNDRDTAQVQVAQLTAELAAERTAHQQTKLQYRAAQAEAARLNALRNARVQAEQKEITDDVTRTFERRLADARALAQRMRGEAARAGEHPAGASGGNDLPGTRVGAAGAAAPAGDHGLSQPAGDELDWRLTATEQAIQLDALIGWVERQSLVPFNSPPAEPGK